jgi:head-tail adaptor
MLTAAQLSGMRSTCELVMDASATIQRKTTTSDGGLGSEATWSDVATVAAHLVLRTGREGQEAGRVIAEGEWLILLPHGTDARIGDRLSVSSTTYEITHLDSSRGFSLEVAAICRRLD